MDKLQLVKSIKQQRVKFMNIGRSIKKALLDKDMTQIQLAEELNKSKSTIHHMSGQKTASGHNIQLLANYFNMKVSEFIALGEDK